MSQESPTLHTPENSSERVGEIKELAKSHIEKEGLLTKLNSKYARPLMFITALTAATACNDTEKTNAQEQNEGGMNNEESAQEDPFVTRSKEGLKETAEERLEQLKRAQELASEMDVQFDGSTDIDLENGVVTTISGEPVPSHLYTPEEQQRIADARDMREAMDEIMRGAGTEDHEAQEEKKNTDDDIILQSGDSDERAY